jgi:hypothetical protein
MVIFCKCGLFPRPARRTSPNKAGVSGERRWHAPLNLKIGIGGLWAGSEHTEIANTPSAAEGGGAVAGHPPIGVVRRPFKEPPLTAESSGATRAALLAMRKRIAEPEVRIHSPPAESRTNFRFLARFRH